MSDARTVQELVADAIAGSQSAWNGIVDRYASLVWSICSSFRLSEADAADVSQAVWLRTVENLHALRVPAALPGWLATTTRNEALKVISTAKRSPSLVSTVIESRADLDSPVLDAALVAAEERAALREAFTQLPEHCQQLLSLLMSDDRPPYAEISARLEMPVGSIGPNRMRCLDKLRRCPALVRWMRS
jgi:RNA polymerase sigma factor (sigma-70 family)